MDKIEFYIYSIHGDCDIQGKSNLRLVYKQGKLVAVYDINYLNYIL